MSNMVFFTDVSTTLVATPTSNANMVCVQKSDTRAVWVDTTSSDPRLQRRITMIVRPPDAEKKVRSKVKLSSIKPILFDEGGENERIELNVVRCEIEVAESSTYADRLSDTRSLLNDVMYVLMNYGTDNDAVEDALKFGVIQQ